MYRGKYIWFGFASLLIFLGYMGFRLEEVTSSSKIMRRENTLREKCEKLIFDGATPDEARIYLSNGRYEVTENHKSDALEFVVKDREAVSIFRVTANAVIRFENQKAVAFHVFSTGAAL